MIFGDAIPSGVQVNGFWVVAAFGASVLGNLALVAVLFIRDRKREIHWGFEPASKRDFEKHAEKNESEHALFDRRIDGVARSTRDHIDEKLEALRKDNDSSGEKIHERINEILEAVGELRGEVKAKRGI